MVEKEDAKRQVKELLDKYRKVVDEGKLTKYKEEGTKQDFIVPLFHSLGWNMEDSNEVSKEENVSSGRVDYGFRISGIPKFYLEAKSLKADLDKEEFAKQAINYSWLKGCTWAILTNFETMKIYNADWKTKRPQDSHLKTILCREFIDRFDELWLLSKESFAQGLLDKEAERWGKKSIKTPIGDKLLADLIDWRLRLSKNILKRRKGTPLTEEDLDEAVQRIIDRLIFIRNCEDRGLAEVNLLSVYNEWSNSKRGDFFKRLNELFRDYDTKYKYDGKLFEARLCDTLEISNEVLAEIIQGLKYTEDRTAEYDFSVIDADVLGSVYEQYLSHILKKTEKRATITNMRAYRKEQGIYYTPTYVVDYIVRNTLGRLLIERKSDVGKIRVLDPACGSGSFLIKVFDVFNEYYSNGGNKVPYSDRKEILANHIFGVDLDPKAVEIAQLNLSLKIAEKNEALPPLDHNIKLGNSLIDDEIYAGSKAFSWEKEFKGIMDDGKFDVVVGNPPYGAELSEKEKEFMRSKYKDDETGNTAALFILRALSLLKDGGYLGFIIPKQLTYIASWRTIRETLLGWNIVSVIDVSEAFEDVELEQVIFIVQKRKRTSEKVAVGFSNKNIIEQTSSNIRFFSKDRFPLWINEKNEKIFDKVLAHSLPLRELAKVSWGGLVAKYLTKERTDDSLVCVRGREVQRYTMTHEYYIKKKNIVQSYYVKGEKLLFQRIVSRQGSKIIANYRDARLVGTYCNDDYYADKTVTLIWDSKIDLKYLLGVLNSRLISWFAHRYLYNRSQLTMEFMYDYARSFPIRTDFTKDHENNVVSLVNKILALNGRLNEIGDKKTDERARIENEINRTDEEIDELIYRIYGLTEEEKKIIEESIS